MAEMTTQHNIPEMFHTKILILGAKAQGIAVASHFLEHNMEDFIVIKLGGQTLESSCASGSNVCRPDGDDKCFQNGDESCNPEKNRTSILNRNAIVKDLGLIFFNSSGHIIAQEDVAEAANLAAQMKENVMYDKGNLSSLLADLRLEQLQRGVNEDTFLGRDPDTVELLLEWKQKTEDLLYGSSSNTCKCYCSDDESIYLKHKEESYQTVLNVLSDNTFNETQTFLWTGKLHLHNRVTKINWESQIEDGDGKVEVVCDDGSVYIADLLIITVPLATMNSQGDSTFVPALPCHTPDTINRMIYSPLDIISLKFDQRWWPEECHGIGLLWKSLPNCESKVNENKNEEWLQEIRCFFEAQDNPNCLCCLISEKLAEKIQQLSDDEIHRNIMNLLNLFTGKTFDVPHNVAVKRSPYTTKQLPMAGTRSFLHPVTNTKEKEVLLFSHQLANLCDHSIINTAIETGWKIADYILKSHRSEDTENQHLTQFPTNESHFHKVAIVGAGISGLAAAKSLIEGGIQDIVILEAQEYAGGRICSVPVGDSYLEAGAQWIHGENNPIYELAKSFNLLSDVVSAEGLGQYIRDDGVILDTDVVFEVDRVVSEILEECETFVSKSGNVPVSIGHYLQQKFSDYLKRCPSDTDEIRRMKEELFDWHIRFQVIDNSCLTLDTLSAKFWGKFIFCGGEDYLNFKQGYSSLIQCLTQKLPDGILKLKRPVVKVKWKGETIKTSLICSKGHVSNMGSEGSQRLLLVNNDSELPDANEMKKEEIKRHLNNPHKLEETDANNCEDYVKITCENGCVYWAEHVIITSSLGYLKRNYKTLFEPSLPSRKIQAIEEMGFAAINKIFLMYDEPWWSADTRGFQLIWSKTNEMKPSKEQEFSWTRDVTGFDVVLTQRAVLLGWVGGNGAILVEDLPEKLVGEHCTQLLQKFTKRNDIPLPRAVYRTRWHNNKYICGGYSNTTSACDKSSSGPALLSEPVYTTAENCHNSNVKHPALLFAGEATHECYFSTTHGAFETGKCQAEFLLEYHSKSKL
ncbi:uncharacterized protein LOC126468312 isoform X1 [Schistocerca serialis cubense]|uniref:uncharacterized protein LOC126468312 isoform X1 n=2 Tax=Schistocerca serialis cubense TaxID=2023355 RepID=UPI00214E1AC6|nr:uncharacterized protein LOC126468312 isoform X1 [Schistocerca serialis cubense]XP_049952498.1 uncharacterized protein LOC126468312 isoform X1 [Schistocerca serialis cubense]